MDKTYAISESEWKVIEVLWKKPHSTIKDIVAALADSGWGYSTIRTLVIRLCEKGAIAADTTIGNYKYYPIATEAECRMHETKSFLARVYGGSLKMLMASLANESELTEKEAQQLMNIIDKMEGDKAK